MLTPASLTAYLTARDTNDRLSRLSRAPARADSDTEFATVLLDDAVRYQYIEGFGGAFTEAAASTFYRMSPEIRREILTAYFDREHGLGYSLCRTHINSCDFSLGNYAYTEVPDDFALAHFSIERDQRALIPMIRQALERAQEPFKLFASPWSPPAWMKTNGEMNHGGKLKATCRESWANYYCRYLRAYQQEGISLWGLTVQNEPAATQTWDSCVYTAEEERDFVRDYLGPALERAGFGQIRLMIWDHNRDLLYERAKVVLDDPEAAKYVWGVGFHWYVEDKFDNVQLVHDAYPGKRLLLTEACQEGGPHLGSWATGERYARSMVNDLNRWAVGWVDWNMLLDETGGPNHVNNLCSAPIIADTKTGRLLYQSSYYYIGHFAKFIRPGAQRILCATTRDALEATAFCNPDGQKVVVVLNRTDAELSFALKYERQSVVMKSPAHSILTLCF